MTDQDRQEIIDLIRSQSKPVEALEAESSLDAVTSLLATRGDTLIRAPMSLIRSIIAYTPYDTDLASRALAGTTLPFEGFVSQVTIQTEPLAEWQAIVFDTARRIFLARSPALTYSPEWPLRPDYMTSPPDPHPHPSRIYLTADGSAFYYSTQHSTLRPITTPITSRTFTFQAIDTKWHILHNFDRYPQVTVQDAEGNEVECEVRHLSPQELTIHFATPIAGQATLT